MDKLKELWSKWKVQVTVVGGVLVVATAYGTCSYQPPSDNDAEEVSSVEVDANATTVSSESTATETTESTATETTESTATTTED